MQDSGDDLFVYCRTNSDHCMVEMINVGSSGFVGSGFSEGAGLGGSSGGLEVLRQLGCLCQEACLCLLCAAPQGLRCGVQRSEGFACFCIFTSPDPHTSSWPLICTGLLLLVSKDTYNHVHNHVSDIDGSDVYMNYRDKCAECR